MKHHVLCIFILSACMALSGMAADAEDALSASDPVSSSKAAYSHQDEEHVYASVYAFAPKMRGNIGLGNLRLSPDIPFSDIWNNLDSTFMGYVSITKGKWGGYIDYQYAKVGFNDQVGVNTTAIESLPVNIQLRSKLRRTSIGVYYTALDKQYMKGTRRFILQPTAGFHFTDVWAKMKASSPMIPYPIRESRSVSWSELYGGVRFLLDFNTQWNISGQVDFGTRHSKGYQAYLGRRIKVFGLPANIRIGYRMIDQKHYDGSFVWKIKEYGPVVGLSLQIR